MKTLPDRVCCRACGETKPISQYTIKPGGGVDRICRACHAAVQRGRRAASLAAGETTYDRVPRDPCPTCGVRQAQHWRCARCSARGHLIPRGSGELCAWCEEEVPA